MDFDGNVCCLQNRLVYTRTINLRVTEHQNTTMYI